MLGLSKLLAFANEYVELVNVIDLPALVRRACVRASSKSALTRRAADSTRWNSSESKNVGAATAAKMLMIKQTMSSSKIENAQRRTSADAHLRRRRRDHRCWCCIDCIGGGGG